jgi:hypothetical protein
MSATVPIQAPEYNPVLLTGRQRLLCALGIITALVGITIGASGLLVLMGKPSKGSCPAARVCCHECLQTTHMLCNHPCSNDRWLLFADVEAQNAWYSKTQFAELWRWLTSKNPMLTAMAINGSLVLLIVCIGYLKDDRNAQKAAAEKKKD